MVCAANEVKVECVVEDGTEKPVSKLFTLPISTPIDEIYKQVSEFCKCESDTIQLECQKGALMKGHNMSLMDLGSDYLNSANPLVIYVRDLKLVFKKKRKVVTKSCQFSLQERRQVIETNLFDFVHGANESTTADADSSQPEKNYVGLVNQAMTCYLNSLLQALYMTPEFRNALYNWEFVDSSEKDQASSIPYQLQKLFLNLQTSTKTAVETTSLTKSFGWDSSEAWQQHDIQELCRVMFDALETKFKDTEQSDLINRLYEGKMIDYVKCLECETEKRREDTFLDIPLPVRPFDSTTAYESVEEALTAFVKYETLDGNNQYHCDKCNKKCDAHKGLKFTKFPYILTLHLKRFDFDNKTLIRIKLNDRVTFPFFLNLNSFIKTTQNQESYAEEEGGMSDKYDDTSTTDSGNLEDECPPCPPCDGAISTNNHSNNHDQKNDEGIDMSNGTSTTNGNAHDNDFEKDREKFVMEEGPYVYELFSIMIHNGSASGGHYYAYIKDFTTNQWLCFNDTTVNPITESHIERVYGGGPTKAYSSSTNAYMLMYRQIDPSKNSSPMREEDFPEHIKALLQKLKESEDDEKRYDDKRGVSYRIKVHYHDKKSKKLSSRTVRCGENHTWSDLKERAYDKFGLTGEVDLDQCRLVFYDSLNHLISYSYEGGENELISEIFKGFDEQPDLLLDIREKDQEFETFKPNGIALQVYVVDIVDKSLVDGPFSVRGYYRQPGKDLKEQLSKLVNIDPQNMYVFMKRNREYRVFQDDEELDETHFHARLLNKVYVTSANKLAISEDDSPSEEFFSLILLFQRVIWVHIELPPTNKDTEELLKSLVLENADKEKANKCPIEEHSNNETEVQLEALKKNSVDSVDGCQNLNYSDNKLKRQIGLESTSEDSSLSDSEKTLVDDRCDTHINKLSERATFPTPSSHNDSDKEFNYYFKGTLDLSEGTKNLLKVFVDERMSFETLKKKLEKFVEVPADSFSIYAQNSDSSLVELADLKSSLDLYSNGQRFCIKLGSDSRKGDIKLKLSLLNPSSAEEPFKYMFDWFVSEDTTVAQAKEGIIAELKQKHNIEIPFERLRLRKKMYNFAEQVLLNNLKFKDIPVTSDDEIAIQELTEDETITDPEQIALFVKLWSRSNLELQPCQEVVLSGKNLSELFEKIETLSGIPEDQIEIMKGKGKFPCENISFLNLDSEPHWKNVKDMKYCSIKLENGCVIFYRNSQEPLKQLTAEEKDEFTNKEKERLNALGIPRHYYSQRREKPLKIYLDSK